MPGSCDARAPRRRSSARRAAASARSLGPLLQPRVHRARQRDPRHARAGHGADRRVRSARGRRARAALRGRLRERSAVPADEPRQRRADEDRRQHVRDDEDLVREHARRHVRAASRRRRRDASPTRSGSTPGSDGSTCAERSPTAGRASRATTRRSPCSPATSAPSRSLAEATDAVNVAQTDRLARIVQSRLEAGDAVGILGLSYKPDTGVIEESPGVALARLLGEDGVRGPRLRPGRHDGGGARARRTRAAACASVAELLERSDVVVIATPWPEFADLPLDALSRDGGRPVVIDCWRLLSDDDLRRRNRHRPTRSAAASRAVV